VAAAGGEGFVVRVLDECGETWEETEDIGDAAVLVDAAGTVAASTTECSLASSVRGREATMASPSWW